MVTYTTLFLVFCVEYVYHEHVHLYTFDLFAEKVVTKLFHCIIVIFLLWQIGFKLLWGCLFFYPMFYGIGTWSLIAPPTATTDISPSQVAAIVVLYLSGWFLTRGANNQKHALKTSPQRKTFGFMQQRTIEGTRILVSGL